MSKWMTEMPWLQLAVLHMVAVAAVSSKKRKKTLTTTLLTITNGEFNECTLDLRHLVSEFGVSSMG